MPQPVLTIELQPGSLKAFVVSNASKIKACGIFPWPDKGIKELNTNLLAIKKSFKLKSDPICILPEPESVKKTGLSKIKLKTVTLLEARAAYEMEKGIFKNKHSALFIELGQKINILMLNKANKKSPAVLDISSLTANYLEALLDTGEAYRLKDYCGTDFFKRKSRESYDKIYNQTQEGSVEGAEMFVEYGSFVGTLIANLEMLFNPDAVAITGPLAQTHDAWSHAMGKARKQHLTHNPKSKINILKSKPEAAAVGAFLLVK
ncbi:MAG TPA: ROK family protein [bacterium]|nr:MAG: hypothetical protein BWY14_00680 [Parcubacteria group bacterium ADurb.Bin192]HPN14940.1 ROK family protein [bacterium]